MQGRQGVSRSFFDGVDAIGVEGQWLLMDATAS
jgi:hypothetical protein